MKNVLVLGGGFTANKRLSDMSLSFYNAPTNVSDCNVVTIDNNPASNPTFVHDLKRFPWPPNTHIRRHEFDEIHAYEVLEHLGPQGDAESFFAMFAQLWWALKQGGLLFASCPSYKSMWAWGDPTHSRIINAGSLVFLQKSEYAKQLGKTSMSDYRAYLVGDWEVVNLCDDGESFRFVMRAK